MIFVETFDVTAVNADVFGDGFEEIFVVEKPAGAVFPENSRPVRDFNKMIKLGKRSGDLRYRMRL